MQDLSCYISFSDAQKRYEIKASALSYRVKALGLKTKRKGRNTFLTLTNISLLDDLDKFLEENPNKTIDEFSSLQKNYYLKSPTEDTLNPQCFTENPLVSQNLPEIQNQINHIFKEFSQLENTPGATEQSVRKDADREQNTAKDREIANLKEEIIKLKKEKEEFYQAIQKCQETAITAINFSNQLAKELNSKKNECNNWENLWSELVPPESIHYIFCKVGERVYLKTNYLDYNYAKSILWRRLSLLNRQN
jgi:vacuolar-type H+-ATPase subunit I/STV1